MAAHAATHRNGARVALKMLHATISASSTVRARFVREGYLANKVDHQGVVRVLDDDVDDSDGAAFLVMDLIEGVTLADRAMERLLDDGEVLDVAAQVLSVLTSAHDKGIVTAISNRTTCSSIATARSTSSTSASPACSTTPAGRARPRPARRSARRASWPPSRPWARPSSSARRPISTPLSGATLFALVCGDFVHAAENPQELMVLVATRAPLARRAGAAHAPRGHRNHRPRDAHAPGGIAGRRRARCWPPSSARARRSGSRACGCCRSTWPRRPPSRCRGPSR